jgi:hypothetical protein
MTTPTPLDRRHRRYGAYILLCWLFFAQVLGIARANSMTVDEGLHVASGYTIWRTGDYRLIEEHPPLVKLWLALPLLPLRSLPDPTALPAWEEAADPGTESLPLLHMAQQLLYPHRPLEHWLLPARAMSALLGVLLLAGVLRWATDLGGARAGAFAALLASFDPNLLAHSAVAGTDLGATALITLGLLAAARFLRRPRWRRALGTGVVLGLALGTKLTATLLGPALGLAGLVHGLTAAPARRRRLLWQGVAVIASAGLTVWGLYRFQIGPVPGVPLPVPAAPHATPIRRLLAHSAEGHPAYLLGENYTEGRWTYFPVAFALKTPLPTLALLVWAGSVALRRGGGRGRERKRGRGGAGLFVVLYIVTSLLSPLNIGYRHLLPLLPLLYVAIGSNPKSKNLSPFQGIQNPKSLLLLAWLVLGTLRVFPFPLTHFNELAGGPRNGWRYLADSNTDWGQGYKTLAEVQRARGLGDVGLAAFVLYDPALYGVRHTPLTPLGGDTPAVFPGRLAPPPGDYVISATPLDGIPLADPEMYDWFRWRAPDAQVANVLHYYHVTPEETAVRWVAQCTVPASPLDDAALAAGFGREIGGQDGLRRVDFDCGQSWVYPGGSAGAAMGRYVVHGALLGDPLRARLHQAPPPVEDAFVARHLAPAAITYRQRIDRAQPAFAVYAGGFAAPPPTPAWARPAGAPPAMAAQPIEAPIALDGPLTFLGATAIPAADDALDVETWWHVTGPGPARPVSIMGHLLAPDGTALAVADGLGVPPALWHPGDVLVQRHTVPRPAEAGALFRTGVYDLDDGARWPVAADEGADALFLRLAPLRTR